MHARPSLCARPNQTIIYFRRESKSAPRTSVISRLVLLDLKRIFEQSASSWTLAQFKLAARRGFMSTLFWHARAGGRPPARPPTTFDTTLVAPPSWCAPARLPSWPRRGGANRPSAQVPRHPTFRWWHPARGQSGRSPTTDSGGWGPALPLTSPRANQADAHPAARPAAHPVANSHAARRKTVNPAAHLPSGHCPSTGLKNTA